MMALQQIGIIGLGTMGRNLSLNFLSKNVSVSVYNRQIADKEVDLAKIFQSENEGAKGFDTLPDFVNSLESPRKILIMVNAGNAVDEVIHQLIPFLLPGDVVIDGGNSYWKDTERRMTELEARQLFFVGVGISGGEKGARNGPSLMPGGNLKIYNEISAYLDAIAAQDKDLKPCCNYIGPGGSGHFVKMIHNGIEYAEMQILAEVYSLFKNCCNFSNDKIASVLKQWLAEGEASYLLEITIDILLKKEGNEFLLDKILDKAEQKGTGSWSIAAALDLGAYAGTIYEAVGARIISSQKSKRTEASTVYHDLSKDYIEQKLIENEVKSAYKLARIINHAIGFKILQEASSQYNWYLDLSEIARIWTNGCIIRSTLMETISSCLEYESDLLLHPAVIKEIKAELENYKHVNTLAILQNISIPVLSSALNYFFAKINKNSSANLIQAQRDYFGAHRYQRNDDINEIYRHTVWDKSDNF